MRRLEQEVIELVRAIVRTFPECGTEEEMNGADTVQAVCEIVSDAKALLKRIDDDAKKTPHRLDLRQVIADLVAWADMMGGWDAPVWERARQATKE